MPLPARPHSPPHGNCGVWPVGQEWGGPEAAHRAVLLGTPLHRVACATCRVPCRTELSARAREGWAGQDTGQPASPARGFPTWQGQQCDAATVAGMAWWSVNKARKGHLGKERESWPLSDRLPRRVLERSQKHRRQTSRRCQQLEGKPAGRGASPQERSVAHPPEGPGTVPCGKQGPDHSVESDPGGPLLSTRTSGAT